MRLYDGLIATLYAVHPADRPYARWQLSQPMANWIADQFDQPRGPAQDATLLGIRCDLANDPGGLRLKVTPPRRWLGSLDGLSVARGGSVDILPGGIPARDCSRLVVRASSAC